MSFAALASSNILISPIAAVGAWASFSAIAITVFINSSSGETEFIIPISAAA